MTDLDSQQWKERIKQGNETYDVALSAADFLLQAKDLADYTERTLRLVSAGIQSATAADIGKMAENTILARALAREATATLDTLTEKLVALRREYARQE